MKVEGPIDSSVPQGAGRLRKSIIVVVVAIAAFALFLLVDGRSLLKQALEWIEELGPMGQLVFVMTYVAATVLLLPGAALGLGAGALFGVVRGSLLVSVGSTLGALCAFLVGRYLARDWVAQKIEGNEKFLALDRAVARNGFKIVFLSRLSPLLPFTLLNYAFALSRVSLWQYLVASWIGMMPGTIMYVYLGSLARAGVQERTKAEWALYGVGLLATLAVGIILSRIARQTLLKQTSS